MLHIILDPPKPMKKRAASPPSITGLAGKTSIAWSSATPALGTLVDAGGDGPWQIRVHWGDNAGSSTDTVFTMNAVGTIPAQAHVYTAAATYTITVTATDANGASASGSFNITVSSAPRVGVAVGSATEYDSTHWQVTLTVKDNGFETMTNVRFVSLTMGGVACSTYPPAVASILSGQSAPMVAIFPKAGMSFDASHRATVNYNVTSNEGYGTSGALKSLVPT